LVGASAASTLSTSTLQALSNGQIACYTGSADSATAGVSTARAAGTPFYFAQGLDRTDAIQKELGLIKSGLIDISKIVSVRKLVGTDDYSRQIKFFGSSTKSEVVQAWTNSATYAAGDIIISSTSLYVVLIGGTVAGAAPTSTTGLPFTSNAATLAYIGTAAASTQYSKLQTTGSNGSTTVGTLEFEANKEYSFSVRVRSAQANSISPFGITRGYAATASNTFVNTISGASTTSNAYAPFSALFGLVKNFSTDVMLSNFAKVGGVLSVSDATNSSVIIFGYSDLSNTLAVNASRGVPEGGVSLNLLNLPTFLSVPAIRTNGGVIFIDVRKFATWNDAMTAITSASVTGASPAITSPYPLQGTVVAGQSYTATLYTEGLEQPTWKNNYDITVFPYKWDYARLNGYFLEGPYGNASFVTNNNVVLPINAGVSTQTPIVYDSTQSGLVSIATIAINPITPAVGNDPVPAGYVVMTSGGAVTTEVKFPNLMKEEVRHIAHQYQSYSSKYKQQFRGVRYNAMVMDPQQEKIDAAGPYTLYYIEYLPSIDAPYTSTQQMTNLTIIAVPTANSSLTGSIDTLLSNTTVTTETAG
jgi:hypothetical protein